MIPTEAQIAEYLELTGDGIGHEAAAEEAFGADAPVRLQHFFSLTDQGEVIGWDTCAKCKWHISRCNCRVITVPEYIKRWQAKRRGLEIDSLTGGLREPLPTPVVTDEYKPVGCIGCGIVITPKMAEVGAFVSMGNDDATNVDIYAILQHTEQGDEQWKCSECLATTNTTTTTEGAQQDA